MLTSAAGRRNKDTVSSEMTEEDTAKSIRDKVRLGLNDAELRTVGSANQFVVALLRTWVVAKLG